MNGDELRDHLRTTLERVGGQRPDVRALRAAAGRRTRRNRLAAAVVAVLVLGAAGGGIAAATTGGSSQQVRAVGSGTTPSDQTSRSPRSGITVDCDDLGTVSMRVGQAIEITGCPAGTVAYEASQSASAVLVQQRPFGFVARSSGRALLERSAGYAVDVAAQFHRAVRRPDGDDGRFDLLGCRMRCVPVCHDT